MPLVTTWLVPAGHPAKHEPSACMSCGNGQMQALFDSTSFFGQEVGGTTQVPLIVGAWPVGQQVPVFESCATGQATGHAQPPPACAVAPAGQVDGVVVAAVGLHVLSDCG